MIFDRLSRYFEYSCLRVACVIEYITASNLVLLYLWVHGYEYRHFVYQFLLMSAFHPVISTRFPAINHDLHAKDKRATGVVCLLFVGRLNSKKPQHLTQINNAHMLVKVFNNLWQTSTAFSFSDRFSHAGVS